MTTNTEVTFEIKESIGVIDNRPNGWTKEINIISWNGGSYKYDIRDWDSSHERMSRGITLTEDQALKLYELLDKRFKNTY